MHYLYDYSPDMEYLEIVSPADFKTVDLPPATEKAPPVTPWKQDQVSSPEELTFFVDHLPRSVPVVLDVVRRIRSWPTSSREQTGGDRNR